MARAVLAVCLTAGGALAVSAPARADFKQPADAWHPDLLRLAEAHRVSKGDGVTVALLDGAVAAHLDLAGAVLPGQRFTSGGEEKQWAGTSAAGLIAARGDGKTGLLGVAPGAKILPVQVRQDSKSDPIDLAEGIDWAVSQGAKVISISYPTFDLPAPLRQAVRRAVAADAVVVTATEGYLPAKGTSLASLPGVVSVGEIGRDGKPSSGRSSDGDLNLDLVAPGDKLVTTIVTSLQNNVYVEVSGQQLAVAIVAGVAALVRSKFADLAAADVVRRLTTTSVDGAPRHTTDRGWGVVNPLAALTAQVPELPAGPANPDPGGPWRDTQWYLDALRIPLTHRVTKGGGVTIGMVTDAMIDGDHPDLRGRVDMKGFIDPSGKVERDVPESQRDLYDQDLFGATGMAGLMVAGGNDGLLGIAPEARVLALVGRSDLTAEQDGRTAAAAGIRWLVDHGAKVVVVLDDETGDQAAEVDAIRYALSRDVVVVSPVPEKHAAPAGVVTVAGIDGGGERGSGAALERPAMSAPGRYLFGAASRRGSHPDDDGYNLLLKDDQTAAAFVAGVAALIRARYPDLDAKSVINRLVSTSTPGPVDSSDGRGIVDPLSAITADVAPVTANPLGDPGPPRDLETSSRSHLKVIGLAAVAALTVFGLLLAAGVLLIARRRRASPHAAPPRRQM